MHARPMRSSSDPTNPIGNLLRKFGGESAEKQSDPERYQHRYKDGQRDGRDPDMRLVVKYQPAYSNRSRNEHDRSKRLDYKQTDRIGGVSARCDLLHWKKWRYRRYRQCD